VHWLWLLTPCRYSHVRCPSHLKRWRGRFQNSVDVYMIFWLKLLRPLLRLGDRNWKQILAFTVPNRLPFALLLSFVYGPTKRCSIPLDKWSDGIWSHNNFQCSIYPAFPCQMIYTPTTLQYKPQRDFCALRGGNGKYARNKQINCIILSLCFASCCVLSTNTYKYPQTQLCLLL
jgi:hypothetical protein